MSGAGAQDRARVDKPPAKERVQVKSQNRAGADGLTAKKRVAGSSVKRALAAREDCAERPCSICRYTYRCIFHRRYRPPRSAGPRFRFPRPICPQACPQNVYEGKTSRFPGPPEHRNIFPFHYFGEHPRPHGRVTGSSKCAIRCFSIFRAALNPALDPGSRAPVRQTMSIFKMCAPGKGRSARVYCTLDPPCRFSERPALHPFGAGVGCSPWLPMWSSACMSPKFCFWPHPSTGSVPFRCDITEQGAPARPPNAQAATRRNTPRPGGGIPIAQSRAKTPQQCTAH